MKKAFVNAFVIDMSEDILSLTPPPADARVAYGSDLNQFIDLRLPKGKQGPFPLAINIHGGFWRAQYNLDHAGHLCAALAAAGFATANLEYRRVGNQGGGWPGTFDDVRTGYRFLLQNTAQRNFDAAKVLVMGHSAGGQLALCLAAHEARVTRMISLAGVVDLQRAYQLHLSNDAVVEFLHGKPNEVPDHYREADPMQLAIPQARQILIHGSTDDIVPPDFSRGYVSAKRHPTANGKTIQDNLRLVEIAGAGHFDLIDPRTEAWKQVVRSVQELLA
jgi:acetyl esterase/lipase